VISKAVKKTHLAFVLVFLTLGMHLAGIGCERRHTIRLAGAFPFVAGPFPFAVDFAGPTTPPLPFPFAAVTPPPGPAFKDLAEVDRVLLGSMIVTLPFFTPPFFTPPFFTFATGVT
jgi:hypothetical protein